MGGGDFRPEAEGGKGDEKTGHTSPEPSDSPASSREINHKAADGVTNSKLSNITKLVATLSTCTIEKWHRLWKHVSHMLLPKSIPKGLSPDEIAVYQKLIDVVENRTAMGMESPNLAVITDLAKDYDDLTAMVLLKELHRLGVIKLEGFVANLEPARKRAQFGRGALDLLGLPHVPIAIGTEASAEPEKVASYPYEFDCSFMAPEEKVTQAGTELLKGLCTKHVETGNKLTFLLISCFKDIDDFSQGETGELLKAAASKFILQGGYSMSSEGKLIPDIAAANNRLNMPAAARFHRFIQENHIPSTVYTKAAAFATPLKPQLFTDLAETRNPVGEHLKRVHIYTDLQFYESACRPDPKDRFVPFMDQEWYLRHKTSWFEEPHEPGTPYPGAEEVTPYLTKVIVYDALAALGTSGDDALDALGVLLPAPATLHKVVGTDGFNVGIRLPEMEVAISALVKGSLLACQQGL